MSPILTPFFFLVMFVGVWLLVLFLTARAGWVQLLAKYQAAPLPPVGKRIGAVSAWIGRSSYRACLTARFSVEGLHLRLSPLYRFCHPPVLIPWASVTKVSEGKRVLSKWTMIECELEGCSVLLKLPGFQSGDVAVHTGRVGNQGLGH